MKIELDALMENSFVITVHEDRFQNFYTTFVNNGLMSPRKFIGYTIPNGTYHSAGWVKKTNVFNCAFSHISIIKMADCLNWPYICIFEDDAYPCPNITSVLPEYLRDIPDDIDMLKIGYLNIMDRYKLESYNDLYYSHAKTWGSHAYIIFRKYYKVYNELFKSNQVPDHLVMNNNDYKILTTKKKLFTQYNNCPDYCTLHKNEIYMSGDIKAFGIQK